MKAGGPGPRAAIRWFLFAYHERCPEALEELVKHGPEHFRTTKRINVVPNIAPPGTRPKSIPAEGALDEDWFRAWAAKFFLPHDSNKAGQNPMKEEAEAHLLLLPEDSASWYFDPSHRGYFATPPSAALRRPHLDLTVTLIDPLHLPPDHEASWRQHAVAQFREELQDLLAEKPHRRAKTLAAANDWYLEADEIYARDFYWLGLKQSGLTYEDIVDWPLDTSDKGFPLRLRDHLGRSERTIRSALEKAKLLVGLDEIRNARTHPASS